MRIEPRMRRPRRLLATIAAVLASAAAADPPAPAASPAPYPVTVAVRLASSSRDARMEYDARLYALPNPSCTVDLAAPTLAAYGRATSAIFAAPPGSPPELELEIEIAASELLQDGRAGAAAVEHVLVLRTAAGAEVDRWRLRGESRVVGLDADGIRNAFERATRGAAAGLERAIALSTGASAWLAVRGIPLRPAPAALAPERPATPRPVWVAFVDAGSALLVAPGERTEFPLTARAGVSGRWVLVDVAYDHQRADSRPTSLFPDGLPWSITSAGLDVAGVLRVRTRNELRAGLGIRYFYGRADAFYVFAGAPARTTIDRSSVSPSVFLAYNARAAVWTERRIGLRVGVELRKHFGATLPAGGFGPEVTVADVTLGITVGAEIGISRADAGDR